MRNVVHQPSAAHEPERKELLEMILRESRHDVTPPDFRAFLLRRDARLDLEYDISWANQFVVGHLLTVFPAAKFIVLIRDCGSWLESLVGHLVSRDVPPDVLAFLGWWFRPERYPHSVTIVPSKVGDSSRSRHTCMAGTGTSICAIG